MEAAFVVYAIPFRFRNTSSSLSKERNGQLLQDIWAVTRRPSTVSVFLGPTFTPIYHIHPPGPTLSTNHPSSTLHAPATAHAQLACKSDLRQFRSDVWNSISTAFLVVSFACAKDSDSYKVSDVPNSRSECSLTGTGLRNLLSTKRCNDRRGSVIQGTR